MGITVKRPNIKFPDLICQIDKVPDILNYTKDFSENTKENSDNQ